MFLMYPQAEIDNMPAGRYAEIPAIRRVADQPQQGISPDQRVPTIVDRIVGIPPKTAHMGSSFQMRIQAPVGNILAFDVYEAPENGAPFPPVTPRLEAAPDGLTDAIIPLLGQGHVNFRLDAVFRDKAFSSIFFAINVTPPLEKPTLFVADHGLWFNNRVFPLRLHIGNSFTLRPSAAFAAAPQETVLAPGSFTAAVLPQSGDPVIAVDAMGKITALRQGNATVRVTFGSSTADQPVFVQPDKPTPNCARRDNPDGTAGLVCNLQR